MSIDVEQRDGYELWDVSGSEQRRVGDGDVYENILIDVRGRGNTFRFKAGGSTGWTIRNVGWRGHNDLENMNIRISGNVDGVVENVYMNQIEFGSISTTPACGGFGAGKSFGGQVTVRHAYVQGFGNNGSYCASTPSGGGQFHFRDCFFANNTPSLYRAGRGSTVQNCVAVIDDGDHMRNHYKGSGNYGIRAFWDSRGGGLHLDNVSVYIDPSEDHGGHKTCVFELDPQSESYDINPFYVIGENVNVDAPDGTLTSGGPGEIRNRSAIGNSPTMSVINGGVPLSAEQAARGLVSCPQHPNIPGDCTGDGSGGNGGNGGQQPSTSHLEITNDSDQRTSYEIDIGGDGQIKRTENFGTGDSVSEDRTSATGFVRGGADAIIYSGCVEAFSYDGPKPTVFRDGSEINADNVVECPPQDEPPSNGGDQPPSNGGDDGDGSDNVDRAVQALGALAIGGSLYKIVRDR